MILFIDDEPRRMEPYIEACEAAGFVAILVTGVDEFWNLLHNSRQNINLLVLDAMLPTGERYKNVAEVLDGLMTGLTLYHEVRRMWPKQKVLLLTQSNNRMLDNAIRRDANAFLRRKQDTLPSDLAEWIEKTLFPSP